MATRKALAVWSMASAKAEHSWREEIWQTGPEKLGPERRTWKTEHVMMDIPANIAGMSSLEAL